jgi:hypothetical protein
MKYMLVVMLYGKVVSYQLHYNRNSCAAAYYRTMMKHSIMRARGGAMCWPLAWSYRAG